MMDPLIARRVRHDPVCEHRTPQGTYCTVLAVGAVLVAGALRSRCPGHLPAGASRLCLVCREPNSTADPFHCARCLVGRDGAADDRSRWSP